MPRTETKIRWNLNKAAAEFGVHKDTISRRIKQKSIEAGGDGKFSTLQICAAVYGDIHGERLLKTRAEREAKELENAEARGQLVSLEQSLKAWEIAILNAKERFTRIPSKLSARYQVGMTLAEFTKLLETEIDETCAELSTSALPGKPGSTRKAS